MPGVTSEPLGTTHDEDVTVWLTPGPEIVHEVLIAFVVQARVAVLPCRTRLGVAVSSAERVPGQIATLTTGQVAELAAPEADTCIR